MKKDRKKFQGNKSKIIFYTENINTCISCGEIIPEGTLVCLKCENVVNAPRCIICNKPIECEESICPSCGHMILQPRKKK